ncbi:NusG domain II-containing protein [Anaerostipes sp.]|uniref:NusG domain II-containing protein n=1 Tax=Anaerostipes sp. TaxID=1872530 RepID=UPI00258C2AC7|nr:NusG domain II-containing protein [Anaerostipes sp.]MCI5622445.1 NusG domain II-containing protein [Anaerostipes sp.]MDY2725583.1 NusG domain II-containing protein [Anaerostipes faecalis]
MKKKDVILISVILGIALISFGIMKFTQKSGKEVVVTVNGSEVFRGELAKSQTFEIPVKDGENVLEIKDGKVIMKEADCPDQICRKHKAIDKSGETIVCLPHKVVIEVEADTREQELDGITR